MARKKRSYLTNPKKKATSKGVMSWANKPVHSSAGASHGKPSRHWKRHKIYQWNPGTKSRRRYRKNPAESPKEIMLMIGGGLATSILGPKLVSKLPVSNLIQNVGMIVAGGALAWFGRKKPLAVGAGAGLVIAGASRALTNAVPMLAGENEMNQDEQTAFIDATAQQMAGEEEFDPYMNGPLSGPLAGPLSGPLAGYQLSGNLNQAAL